MARRATLTFRPPPDGPEQLVELDPNGETTVGRYSNCTITISTPSVSRRHARIFAQGGGYYVEDLQSSNGTYINNQRVERGSLVDGDELRCGDFAMRFAERAAPSSTRDVSAEAAGALSAVPRVVGQIPRRAKSNNPVGRPEPEVPAARPVPRPTSGALPPAGGSDPAEVASLRQQLESLRAERNDLDSAKAELESDLQDKARRIRDLEGEELRSREQIKTLTDRSLRLREEVTGQQRQLEEYRVEKADLDYALTQARQEIATLRQTQESSSRNEAGLTDQINDLKREVRTRDKQLREAEQRLDVLEYDLKAAREENENLKLALGEDDSRRRESNTTLEHLRQVLSEKESMIEGLQHEVRTLRDRLAQAEDKAREDAGARATRLEESLRGAEQERDRLTQRLQATQVALDEARASSGNASREALQEIDNLKRANRDLRIALEQAQEGLEDARRGGGAAVDDGRVAALQRRFEELESAREEIEAQLTLTRAAAREAESRAREAEGRLREAEVRAQRAEAAAALAQPVAALASPVASPGGGGASPELVERTLALYQSLNDLASELRNNLRLAVGCVDDVKAVATLFDGLPDDALPARTRAQIEEADLGFTLETITEMLSNAEATARNFKKLMLGFREFLNSQGLGE